MDSFLRKQKPRPRTTPSSPPPTLTEAPRAIVRPATTRNLDHTNLSAPSNTLPPEQTSISVPGSLSNTPKPRKRFRKKVSGLFGDQTELKKRMSKLLIPTPTDDIAFSVNNNADGLALSNPVKNRAKTPTRLIGADGIVARLEEATADKDTAVRPKDEFDTPEFVATASRVLGSPEKLQTVRKSMGRLSPRSNERFLAQLQLGTPPRERTDDQQHAPITPPELPSVDSSEFDSERELLTSPVSVERTGAPAVLRRKARRLDRGYRSADVLRARLGGEFSRSRKRVEGFGLDLKDFRGEPRNVRRKEKANASDYGEAETDTEEDVLIQQPSSSADVGRALMVNDPLQMLVEVAAVEQKNSAPSRHRGNISCEPHGQKRKIEDVERGSKRRKENRKTFAGQDSFA